MIYLLTKKILFVTPRYYPYIGGVEYVVKSVAERLVRKGFHVSILAGDPNIKVMQVDMINDIKVYRWPVWVIKESFHIPKDIIRYKLFLHYLITKYDLIHIHNIHSIFTVYTGVLSCKTKKIIVTTHYHGRGHFLISNILWFLWKYYVNKLIECAKLIHAVSIIEVAHLLKHFPNVAKKVIVIPNGVEPELYNYTWLGKNSTYVIYAGRIERYKNIELAYLVLKKIFPSLKFVVVGNGSYVKALKKKLRDNVYFLPPLPREKYIDLLSKARFAINLSNDEAFSIFIAESIALGVPVIVSNTIAKIQKLKCKDYYIMDKTSVKICEPDRSSIKTWEEIVSIYINKLYENTG